MLEGLDEATYSLENLEKRAGSEAKRSFRTRRACSLSYSCWSSFQEGYSRDSPRQKVSYVGNKCPTRGELSRHDERLRLIGGRIRACSCTYIGGKYHDDAWVRYLLGTKRRPITGTTALVRPGISDPGSSAQSSFYLSVSPMCHLRYSGLNYCLCIYFAEARIFLRRAIHCIQGITLFMLPVTYST